MPDGRHGMLYATRQQTDNTGREMFRPYATTGAERIKVKVKVMIININFRPSVQNIHNHYEL